MHEAEKIRQAQYHRQQMAKVEGDPEAFRNEFSAFAVASRSVLQFALKEAETKPGGQAWYDSVMARSALLGFFKEKRNLDIHEEPVTIPKDIELQLHEAVAISDSLVMELIGPDGRVKQRYESDPPASRPRVEAIPPKIVYRYRFRDWHGPEEVPILCDNLITELKAAVAEGQRRGYLTA